MDVEQGVPKGRVGENSDIRRKAGAKKPALSHHDEERHVCPRRRQFRASDFGAYSLTMFFPLNPLRALRVSTTTFDSRATIL